jgi:hypothetical protein
LDTNSNAAFRLIPGLSITVKPHTGKKVCRSGECGCGKPAEWELSTSWQQYGRDKKSWRRTLHCEMHLRPNLAAVFQLYAGDLRVNREVEKDPEAYLGPR